MLHFEKCHKQVAAALRMVEPGRHPLRDRVMLLLSIKIGEVIALTNRASKGRNGGRTIPMHPELRAALEGLSDRVIRGALCEAMTPVGVQVWFRRFYRGMGWTGASSHSGRRTFVTKAARKIVEAGGSLKDVQELAGHASLSTTQRYIQGDADAKRRVIGMI